MIPITTPYDYKSFEKITNPSGFRLYVTPEGNVPSVTTILSSTMISPELDAWRERVGDKEADRIKKEAAGLGTLVHTHIEMFVVGMERPAGNNFVRILSKNMADSIINNGLVNISEIWTLEQPLYFPYLYAGTADCIALHNNIPSIIDYKSTRKISSSNIGKLDEYKCQLAAYAIAHNEIYGTDINQGVIFMVDRECEFQEYIISGLDFEKAKESWFKRVDQYYSKLSQS